MIQKLQLSLGLRILSLLVGVVPLSRLTFKLLKMTEEMIGMIVGFAAIGLIAIYVNLSSRKLVKK